MFAYQMLLLFSKGHRELSKSVGRCKFRPEMTLDPSFSFCPVALLTAAKCVAAFAEIFVRPLYKKPYNANIAVS